MSASESVKRGVRAIFLVAALVLSAAAVYLGFTESWSISAFFIVVASGLALGAVSMLAPRR